MAPRKNVAEEKSEEPENKKRKVAEIKLTNARRIENKSYLGEVIEEAEIVIDNRDWEKVLIDHREKLEKETRDREKKIERKEIKEKSWALYIECKRLLEENEKNWEKAKKERELEEKRKYRLEIAKMK